MTRYIAFDKQTAQAISANLHFLASCDPHADPLQSALQSSSPQVLLALPADSSGGVLIARFQRNPGLPVPSTTPSTAPVSFAAGGFLGLSDEPIFDPQPPTPKKWWQKLLD